MKFHRQPTFLLSAPCCPSSCEQQHVHSHKGYFNDECVFQVAWSINPHMKVGAACPAKALSQHTRFAQSLREAGAQVIMLPFVHGAYDSVFIKDSAIVKRSSQGLSALIAQPVHSERKLESEQRRFNLKKWGVEIAGQSRSHLEGGDVVVFPAENKVFMGYGFRTERKASLELSHFFDATVIPLQLKDPHFYHLDVALSVLSDGTAFACREAFTDESWQALRHSGIHSLIPVHKEETMKFGLNWVEVDDTIVMGSYLPRLKSILEALGKKVIYSPLDQFQLAGGSAACLVSRIHDFDTRLVYNQSAGFEVRHCQDIVLSS
ncbi:hypothetical protein AZI86_11515 [Bdellovibrio bacteriovorus]|uniref:Amidinotransferase n=1 Tax=Bdellovibrio bacteriovorus TaxID=959 RepID=A0A150WLK8_BDEBC|nr:arginine deiminase-related protein [Bdellovibrio bacteriovorus]KYG64824.1 hypothetical protein AZI86_11515 [Bdellovibrio bacteriovorus]